MSKGKRNERATTRTTPTECPSCDGMITDDGLVCTECYNE